VVRSYVSYVSRGVPSPASSLEMIGFNYGDSSSGKELIYPERDPVAAHSDIRLDLFLCWQTIAVEMI
jgi:hypothetical protein